MTKYMTNKEDNFFLIFFQSSCQFQLQVRALHPQLCGMLLSLIILTKFFHSEIVEGQWENFPDESNADAKWENQIVVPIGNALPPIPPVANAVEFAPIDAPVMVTRTLLPPVVSAPVRTSILPNLNENSPKQSAEEFTIGTPLVAAVGDCNPATPMVSPIIEGSEIVITPSSAHKGSLYVPVAHVLKVIILGDASVGKTALIQRFVTGQFSSLAYKPTVGADFYSQKLEFSNLQSGEKTLVTLQIWDTAGQERYRSLAASFYRGADVCMLVHDASRPATLASIAMWKADFLRHAAPTDPDSFPFVYLRNKSDLVYPATSDSVGTFSVSAKTGENVTNSFHYAAQIGVKRIGTAVAKQQSQSRLINLNSLPTPEAETSSCQC